MRSKNNIESVKENIKNHIRKVSILVFKYSYDSDYTRYSEALNNGNYRKFSISRDEIRTVDKRCDINGKRSWIFPIAVKEMAESGEIIVSNSYQSASSNSYAKSYPLTVDGLKSAVETFGLDIKLIRKTSENKSDEEYKEWNPDDGFLDKEDQIDSNGRWMSECYYTEKELKNVRNDFKNEKNYVDYLKKNNFNKNVSNKFTYEG